MATKHCPNCGGEVQELKDNRVLCVPCNSVYKIEVDGTAKVVDSDPLDKIHKRLDALEVKVTPPELTAETARVLDDTGLELEPKFFKG